MNDVASREQKDIPAQMWFAGPNSGYPAGTPTPEQMRRWAPIIDAIGHGNATGYTWENERAGIQEYLGKETGEWLRIDRHLHFYDADLSPIGREVALRSHQTRYGWISPLVAKMYASMGAERDEAYAALPASGHRTSAEEEYRRARACSKSAESVLVGVGR